MAKKIAIRGNGHIKKLDDGRYFVQVMIGTSSDGKQVKKSKTCKNLKEATKFRDDCLKLKAKNAVVVRSAATLEEWINKYLDHVKENLTACSNDSYRYAANRIIKDIGHYKLQKVSRKQIQQYIDSLSKVRKLKPKTIIHDYTVIRETFKYAVLMEEIPDSPCNLIQLPKNTQNTKVKIWSDKEVEKFKEALKNHRYKCAFILGLLGLRKSEVVGLQIEDIDFIKKRIHVQHQYLWHTTGYALEEHTKTKSSNRVLPITDEFADMLKEQIGDRTSGFVFLTRLNTPVKGQTYVDAFKKLILKAGLPDINLHKLRHICSSQMAAKKISARTIADWLGHSKVNMTLDVYTHSNEETLKEALEILESKKESKN